MKGSCVNLVKRVLYSTLMAVLDDRGMLHSSHLPYAVSMCKNKECQTAIPGMMSHMNDRISRVQSSVWIKK